MDENGAAEHRNLNKNLEPKYAAGVASEAKSWKPRSTKSAIVGLKFATQRTL
jgi:hypothetical protein